MNIKDAQYIKSPIDEKSVSIKATVDGERQVLEGLVRRREAESLLFTGEDWSKV